MSTSEADRLFQEQEEELARVTAMSPAEFHGDISGLIRELWEVDTLEAVVSAVDSGLEPNRYSLRVDGRDVELTDRDVVVLEVIRLLQDWLTLDECNWVAASIFRDPSASKGRPRKDKENAWRREAEAEARYLAASEGISLPKAVERMAKEYHWPVNKAEQVLEFIGRTRRRK